MSEQENTSAEGVDNWVFDSLVNFLHGSIWKVPVVGFIEEKSVVFDPDSYNNMTDEKEQEFRKIHEEYKAVVDFMLSSFMEDLQVTPEQVEEACSLREHQSKTLPESHITKVALEQLWAAEDFTAFRRLMTRKNIDLQLQSLELLVAKYGVLSPALRSGDSEEPTGEDGEDDFLQVVIRYSDQLELFKCDYGAEGPTPGNTVSPSNATDLGKESKGKNELEKGVEKDDDANSKNMKLHLSGIRFKNDVAPTPVQYQATLTSSSTSLRSSSSRPSSVTKISKTNIKKQASLKMQTKSLDSIKNIPIEIETTQESQGEEEACSNAPIAESTESDSDLALTTPPPPPTTPSQFNEGSPTSLSKPQLPEEAVLDEQKSPELKESPTTPTPHKSSPITPTPTSPIPTMIPSEVPEEAQESQEVPVLDSDKSKLEADPGTEISEVAENLERESLEEGGDKPQVEIVEPESESDKKSQLIQLEEAEANMETGSKEKVEGDAPQEIDAPPTDDAPKAASATLLSPGYDEKTVADIASTAPEQRRLLTAVRKALEINPDESTSAAAIDIPSPLENDEDLQKRREYLRAQRDKLIAIKKQEREKLLLANTSESGGSQQPARPKSARAAQMAIKNPGNMRAASLSEKSLSARRALADRLKQELIEK